MGRKEEILEKVRNIAAPLAAAEGLELVDVEFAGAGGHPTLRLYIDKAGGVSLDDCTHVSRALSAALDVEDPIQGSYELEVSSPGLDRPLRTAEHFQRFAGENVRVKTYGPLEERALPATGGGRRPEHTEKERALPATGGGRRPEHTEKEPASPATGGARKRGASGDSGGSRKTFVGRLMGLEGEDVLVEVEGAVFRIPQHLIAKANIEPRFDGGLQESAEAAPRARLSIDGRYLLVNGRADVRHALRDIRKADRAEVWVRREEAALGALFHDGRAILLLTADDGPLASSRDPHKAVNEADRLRVRRASGDEEEYPSSWAVAGDDAARALEHFFLTGQRPSFIHWHDDTTQQR
ncbi:MAG: Imm1 family immunity protein [Myxococcales bacterium]